MPRISTSARHRARATVAHGSHTIDDPNKHWLGYCRPFVLKNVCSDVFAKPAKEQRRNVQPSGKQKAAVDACASFNKAQMTIANDLTQSVLDKPTAMLVTTPKGVTMATAMMMMTPKGAMATTPKTATNTPAPRTATNTPVPRTATNTPAAAARKTPSFTAEMEVDRLRFQKQKRKQQQHQLQLQLQLQKQAQRERQEEERPKDAKGEGEDDGGAHNVHPRTSSSKNSRAFVGLLNDFHQEDLAERPCSPSAAGAGAGAATLGNEVLESVDILRLPSRIASTGMKITLPIVEEHGGAFAFDPKDTAAETAAAAAENLLQSPTETYCSMNRKWAMFNEDQILHRDDASKGEEGVEVAPPASPASPSTQLHQQQFFLLLPAPPLMEMKNTSEDQEGVDKIFRRGVSDMSLDEKKERVAAAVAAAAINQEETTVVQEPDFLSGETMEAVVRSAAAVVGRADATSAVVAVETKADLSGTAPDGCRAVGCTALVPTSPRKKQALSLPSLLPSAMVETHGIPPATAVAAAETEGGAAVQLNAITKDSQPNIEVPSYRVGKPAQELKAVGEVTALPMSGATTMNNTSTPSLPPPPLARRFEAESASKHVAGMMPPVMDQTNSAVSSPDALQSAVAGGRVLKTVSLSPPMLFEDKNECQVGDGGVEAGEDGRGYVMPLIGAGEEVETATFMPSRFRALADGPTRRWKASDLLTREDDDHAGGVLGGGAFATVLIAKTREGGHEVAVKAIARTMPGYGDQNKYINRELELLEASSGHPNVVDLLGTIKTLDTVYMVMPLASTDVGHLIESQPLPESRVLPIMRQLLSAVEYVHSMDIVHRDLKPANLLIQGDGGILLADFGVAKRLDGKGFMTGVAGTKPYLAPEQLSELPYSEKADVWAAGVVAYEMLHGRTPFCPQLGSLDTQPTSSGEGDDDSGRSDNPSESDSGLDSVSSYDNGSSSSSSSGNGAIFMELPQEKAEASSEETGDDGSCDDNDNHHHNNGKNQGVKLANGGGNNHTVTAQQGAGEYTADFYEELEKQSILAGAYVVNPDRVSSEAADFIADLLQRSPEVRASAAQASEHPWLGGGGAATRYRTFVASKIEERSRERAAEKAKRVKRAKRVVRRPSTPRKSTKTMVAPM